MALQPHSDTPFLPVCLCPGNAGIAGKQTQVGVSMVPRSPHTRLTADPAGLVISPSSPFTTWLHRWLPPSPLLASGSFHSQHHAGSDPGISHGGHRGKKRVPGCGRMRIPSWQEPEAFLCMQQSRGTYTAAFPAPEKAGKPFPYPAYTSGPCNSLSSQRVRNRLSSEPSVPQRISREQAFPSDPDIGTGHVDIPAASARSRI